MYSKFIDYIKPIYSVDISKHFPKDTLIVFDEITRIITIQVIIQVMFTMSNGECMSFEVFFATLMYTVVGICVYWLVLKKFISFK